jgi:hypothetical protein
MRTTQTILEMVHDRGKRGLSLERVYRLLYNKNVYLTAYGKLYANDGAMTQGVDANDTIQGMKPSWCVTNVTHQSIRASTMERKWKKD